MFNRISMVIFIFMFCYILSSAALSKDEIKKIKSLQKFSDLLEVDYQCELELPHELQMDRIFYIVENDNYICYATMDRFVGVWKKNGEFIGEVGRIGKGPGEYISPWTAYFKSNDLYVVDGAPRLISKFTIINDKIKYEDRYDIFKIAPFAPAAIIPYKDCYFYLFASMLKGMPRVSIIDDNFKKIKDFAHITQKETVALQGTWLVSNKYIIVTDAWIREKNKPTVSTNDDIIIYDLSGKKIRIIHRKSTEKASLLCDSQSKILIVRYLDRVDIFSIENGKRLQTLKRKKKEEDALYDTTYVPVRGDHYYTVKMKNEGKKAILTRYRIKLY